MSREEDEDIFSLLDRKLFQLFFYVFGKAFHKKRVGAPPVYDTPLELCFSGPVGKYP